MKELLHRSTCHEYEGGWTPEPGSPIAQKKVKVFGYKNAKDRNEAEAYKPPPRGGTSTMGPAHPEGMLTGHMVCTKYDVKAHDLRYWRQCGLIKNYGRSLYSEREIRAALSSRDDYGQAESKRVQRHGLARLTPPRKNFHDIG